MKWCWSLLWLFSATHACETIDDAGNKLNLSKPAQRIISLAPDITETLFTIGASKKIIGVVSNSDYPLAAQKISRVGSYSGINVEKIILLHPDLVVVWGQSFSRQLSMLKKFDIPVYVTQPSKLEDIPRTMKNLGCLAGTDNIANKAAEKFLSTLTKLRAKYSRQQPIKVFYQIGAYSLITVNQSSWINQVISVCGGVNIFANTKFSTPEISWEAVVAAQPQVIISDVTNSSWKTRWLKWTHVPAVKNHLLFSINPDLIDRAGPRLLEGAEQMCEYLQAAR